jgi:exonuclease SbcC
LHRLEITAFGPFSGTEDIDFDALSEAGLFLIQGQTGAGKTSILDAVCFALYGQVPGARNHAKVLRSDHARPGTAPQVVLETTIRGRRLRVTRSPKWERPKLRGAGTKAEQPHVLLEEFEHGRWVALSTRLDEAGDLIGRLLGMTAAQFCQVVLLPQGEFAGFLRARADDRRKVLERLFATEIFTQVEKWLAERRRETHREAADLRDAAESIADRVAEISRAASARSPRSFVPAPRQGDPAAAEPLEEVEALPAWATELEAHHAPRWRASSRGCSPRRRSSPTPSTRCPASSRTCGHGWRTPASPPPSVPAPKPRAGRPPAASRPPSSGIC